MSHRQAGRNAPARNVLYGMGEGLVKKQLASRARSLKREWNDTRIKNGAGRGRTHSQVGRAEGRGGDAGSGGEGRECGGYAQAQSSARR